MLFNRFYQPDFDIEELDVRLTIRLSEPFELLPRLHAVALISGRVDASVALTGGVHDASGAIKALMAGADVAQCVSVLLKRGPGHLASIRRDLESWLIEHEYESLGQLLGSLDLSRCPDPEAYERSNYAQILESWRSPELWPEPPRDSAREEKEEVR